MRRYVAYMAGFHACRGLVNSTLVLYLVDSLHLSLASTGALLAIDLIATLIAEIPTGIYADVRGRGRSFFLACVLSFVGYLVYGCLPALASGVSSGASVLAAAAVGEAALSVGFAFYSGALDAWIVDSLSTAGTSAPVGQVLARGQTWKNLSYMTSGVLGVMLYHAVQGFPFINGFLLSALAALALTAYSRRLIDGAPRRDATADLPPALRAALSEARQVLAASTRHVLAHRSLSWAIVAGGPCFALIQVLAYYWPYLLVKDMASDASPLGGNSAPALAASWILGYGARAIGNEASRKLIGSRLPRAAVLAGVTVAGSALVTTLVVLPVLPGRVLPLDWVLAVSTLVYGAARFFDGMADPLRQWLLADLTEAQGRATQFSIASSFALAFSALVALAAAGALDHGFSVWHVLTVGALLQLTSAPIYLFADRGRARNGHA